MRAVDFTALMVAFGAVTVGLGIVIGSLVSGVMAMAGLAPLGLAYGVGLGAIVAAVGGYWMHNPSSLIDRYTRGSGE